MLYTQELGLAYNWILVVGHTEVSLTVLVLTRVLLSAGKVDECLVCYSWCAKACL
jgi:hypothetical protein